MSKLNMTLVRIFAPRKERKGILEQLQKMSVLDISAPKESLPETFFREDKTSDAETFRRNAMVAERALDTINRVKPQKKSLLSSFSGRRIVSLEEANKAKEIHLDVMKVCYEVESLERENAEAKENCMEVMLTYKREIDQERTRQNATKNGFIWTCCQQNIDQLTAEKNAIEEEVVG